MAFASVSIFTDDYMSASASSAGIILIPYILLIPETDDASLLPDIGSVSLVTPDMCRIIC